MTSTLSLRPAVRAGLTSSLVLALSAAGCTKAPPPAPPPAEVSVVTVTPRTIDEVPEFVGSVESSRSVPVRAQVTGVIVARPFVEGAAVKAGDVLYRIDPRTYEAAYRSAQARLAEAEARVTNAEANLARLKPLLADNAISRQDYDNAEAEAKQARAGVEDARGAVDATRKAFEDTDVRAEISGRVGKAELEVGTRVRGTDDVLTTIDVLSPVYVTFSPTGQQLLDWRRDPRASRLLAPGGAARVEAVLSDGTTLPVQGRIDFIDPVLNPATGAQTFRASFPNADRLLLPGQFVRIRVLGLVRDNAILVPQRAVLQQMGRQLVFVVAPGDTVQAREVEATSWSGDQWLIARGLGAGDRVVVDGIQKIGPGRPVRPVPLADSVNTAAAVPSAAPRTMGGGK
ncbi:MAG TPA: efflux RND transporter periplasmic adaptor subunit [Gemmatimonadales bacterium]|nr:efflux RND transporter periplasmic adaptor subunit [Gemmatimonadales bacterium]